MKVPPISATNLVDESGRPFFDRERGFEAAFLTIRAAQAAKVALDQGVPDRGAIVLFPVVCYSLFEKGSACGAAGQRAITVDHEPGTVFPPGVTPVCWSVAALGVQFSGVFYVSVGGAPPPRATCVASRGSDKVEVPSPFASANLSLADQRELTSTLRRLVASEDDAMRKVLSLSEGMTKAMMRRLAPRFYGVMDEADARQEVYRQAIALARRFGSPNRQQASWARVFMLGCTKAVERALDQVHGVGRPDVAVRRLIEADPSMATAPVHVLRAELEKRVAEASDWSDERLEAARHGPPSIVPDGHITQTAAAQPDAVSSGAADRSMFELLSTLLPTERSWRAALPYLVHERWVTGDRSAYDKRQIAKAKAAFMESVARALSVQSGTRRGIVEKFARDGERYDDPADRAAMVQRARSAVGAMLGGGAG